MTFNHIINHISYELAEQSVTDDGQFIAQFKEKLAPFCDLEDCCTEKCHYMMRSFLRSSQLSATVALSTEIEKYKVKFNDELDGNAQYAIIQDILQNDSLVQVFINKRQNNPAFTEKLNKLNKFVDKKFGKRTRNTPTTTQTTSDTTNSQITSNETTPKKSSGGFGWLGWLTTILLLICIVFYLYYLRPHYQKRVLALKKQIGELKRSNQTLNGEIEDLQSLVTDLNEKNASLFENENQLRDQLADLEKAAQKAIEQEEEETIEEEAEPEPLPYEFNEDGVPVYDVFYMPAPYKDGSFESSHQHRDFEWTKSVYKFEIIDEEGTKAIFSMMQDPRMMKRAINSYTVYIEPVCEVAHAFNVAATQIQTETKGQVSLDNDIWRLDEKAMISLQ